MQHPHVLLITVDHWPGSLLACGGHETILTPTIDEMASLGVRFSNAYSECPICIPARRTIMTGMTPRNHGIRRNQAAHMPKVPTLAQCFRDAGYQAYAVGKLHVYPQRQRIGFDDVWLDEEGRGEEGVVQDDYELFLGDHGYAGMRFAGGMSNNQYIWRPWHLPERFHATNWTAATMCRMIRRRDPLKPCLLYLSFSHPHPPLTPLQAYLDIYRDREIPDPYYGEWTGLTRDTSQDDDEGQESKEEGSRKDPVRMRPQDIRDARKAFYAQCTHIDHQIRIVLGALRQEEMLQDTVVMFTSDHGDMLGNHGLWAKARFYEDSARVPMVLMGTQDDDRIPQGAVDDRIVGQQDILPTLLGLAGIYLPPHAEGMSMIGENSREYLYGEFAEAEHPISSRMIRRGPYKLIYHPNDNRFQLFDVENDPHELHDLHCSETVSTDLEDTIKEMKRLLAAEFYDEDLTLLNEGTFVGRPAGTGAGRRSHTFGNQRGLHWPPPYPRSEPGWY